MPVLDIERSLAYLNNRQRSCSSSVCVLRYSRVEIHRSAFKHGVAVEDIVHAVENAIEVVDLDVESDPPKVLAIGPDRSGRWLEVIWLRFAGYDLVIHAMRLRKVFERLLEAESNE